MKRDRCALPAALLAAVLVTVSCGGEKEETEELIRPVRYEEVFATGGARIRTFSGTARSGMESKISFRVGGTMERCPVRVGDRVEEGALLAALEDEDYRLQVQEAEAALAQAEAQERNARANYDRAQALYENRNASRQDLDGARAAWESASAQVRSIEKRLELARLRLSYTRLLAPFDGRVAEVLAEEKENVSPGAPVLLLTAGGRAEVSVAVPEVLIARIRPGGRATVSFDALPGEEPSATVIEVGVASTGFATTFPVTVRLDREIEGIRPGMAAEVSFRFESADARERLIVPASSVGEDRRGRFVFVVEPGEGELGTARRVPVVVGDLTPEGLEIREGLREGDLVVTAGVSRIRDGQKVRLL